MVSFAGIYDELPPSPTEHLSFNLDAFGGEFQTITPKRKKTSKAVKAPSKKRKRASNQAVATNAVLASTSTSDESTILSEMALDPGGSSQETGDLMLTSQDSNVFEIDSSITTWDVPNVAPSNLNLKHHVGNLAETQGLTDGKQTYYSFVEAVFTAEADFWQISSALFIVSGWNREANISTNAYYHLAVRLVQGKKQCHCRCPEGVQMDECVHTRFIKEHGGNRFSIDHKMKGTEDEIFLFSRNVEQYEPLSYRNILSVPGSTTLLSVKNRAIVEYLGDDVGTGTWMCSKHSDVLLCPHIQSAKEFLQQSVELEEMEESEMTESSTGLPTTFSARNLVGDFPAVSYRPIPPPRWARIQTDDYLPVIPALSQPPQLIPLTANSSCPCTPDLRSKFTPGVDTKPQSCEVYGLTRAWKVDIEIQKCPSCRNRFIGPDCQELGLFNWNNRVLLTHDLLDDYTSSYVNSETPFVAWTSVLSRRYQTFESPLPFLSEKRFRTVWFAYAQLLELNNDMRCSKCGPSPKVTIWDGVTLAFSRKNLTSSICPPTRIHAKSKIRDEARHPDKPQCLRDSKLRKLIRSVLSGPPLRLLVNDEDAPDLLITDGDISDDDTPEEAASKKAIRATLARQVAKERMQFRVEQVPDVIEQLGKVAPSLANLFNRCYGPDALTEGEAASPAYAALFLQFASEDSALQLMTKSVVDALNVFIGDPTFEHASYLTMFPALHKVVMLELAQREFTSITEDLLGVCDWVMIRADAVSISVTHHEGGEEDAQGTISSQDWRKTGCLYSMPQIRFRPSYPLIARDGMNDVGGQAKRGTGCGKYYSEYGQKRLTGGIMVVWCTHGLSYGFHCIPTSEGRNEVFSAIYTHWETAPEIVIYDYACNLAPYMMAREPTFFANTKCLIDHFHSMGHTACGNACKLMTYVTANPDLDKINSSAAECGNSGILRIRKSVSYMTQDHAIIYTKVFFSIRNRLIIRRQEKERRRD